MAVEQLTEAKIGDLFEKIDAKTFEKYVKHVESLQLRGILEQILRMIRS